MSRAGSELNLTLFTPSRGVQQWRDDHRTRIGWTSSGGRGLPRTVIILPVEFVEARTRWAPPRRLMEELERDPEGFWTEHKLRHEILDESVEVGIDDRDNKKDPAAPRAVTVPNNCGARWRAHHVVVLLIYDEFFGIGEEDALSANGRPVDKAATYVKEIELMKSFFNGGYVPRLVTRGLVRLPPLSSRADAAEVVFALASCQYPAGMTDGAPNDHSEPEAPSSASLLGLSRLLTPATSASPSLLVLAGDQVYVDATAGLFDARSQSDRLRLPYQDLFYSPGAQSVFGLLPVVMMLDDHEIVDNWEPGIKLAKGDTVDQRVEAYRRFQRVAGPPLRPGALWCEFRHSRVPFFLTDTRTERNTPDRSPRRVDNWREAQIMGGSQWKALCAFLITHKDEASFVVSPSMFLPRALGLGRDPGLGLESDNWDGFPASRRALLALLCDHDLERVVFLSGDAHTSCVAQATVTRGDGHRATLWSVHSSGLYCPYPFANGSQDNYASAEAFRFEHTSEDGQTHKYTCAVKTLCWHPGDGFATLALTSSDRGRQGLRVCFHRAGKDVPEPPLQISIGDHDLRAV